MRTRTRVVVGTAALFLGILAVLPFVPGIRRWLGVLRHTEFHVSTPVEAVHRTPERASVVLIVLDTTRADELSPYASDPVCETPHLQALADRGVVFESCYAATAYSGPSYASLFTGAYPVVHGVFDHPEVLPDENRTLFEMAKEAGLYTVYLTQHQYLRRRWNYDQGADSSRYGPDDDYLTSDLEKWIVKNPEVGFLAFLALITPHYPYDQGISEEELEAGLSPEEYTRHRESSDYDKMFALRESGFSREYVRLQRQGYRKEIERADALVGRVISRLEATGRLDNTVVIVTADHGEAFGEHGVYFAHDPDVRAPVTRVPLILSWPEKLEPRRVSEPVSLIDVMPTVAEWIGGDPGSRVQGRSLAPLLAGASPGTADDRVVFSYARPMLEDRLGYASLAALFPAPGFVGTSILGASGPWDVVLTPTLDEEHYRYEVYDRTKDPLHVTDLRSQVGSFEEVEKLVQKIWRYRDEILEKAPKGTMDELSEEQKKALEELGYLQGS